MFTSTFIRPFCLCTATNGSPLPDPTWYAAAICHSSEHPFLQTIFLSKAPPGFPVLRMVTSVTFADEPGLTLATPEHSSWPDFSSSQVLFNPYNTLSLPIVPSLLPPGLQASSGFYLLQQDLPGPPTSWSPKTQPLEKGSLGLFCRCQN